MPNYSYEQPVYLHYYIPITDNITQGLKLIRYWPRFLIPSAISKEFGVFGVV